MTRARDIADLVDSNGDIKSTALDNVSTDLVGDTTPQLGGDLDTGTNTIDLSGHTGAAKMAKGTTAQRPSTPAEGMFELNTTTNEPGGMTQTTLAGHLLPTKDVLAMKQNSL